MAHLPPGKVWLASYPKSGNTWMRILLSNLLAGGDRPEDINDLGLRDHIASARRPLEDEFLADSTLLTQAELVRVRSLIARGDDGGEARVTKVHDAYDCDADGEPLLGRRARCALYVARDPRDVVVSLAAHNGSTIDTAIRRLCDPETAVGGASQVRHRWADWSGHARSWLEQGDLPVHLVRYEDLSRDPLGTFGAALDFLGASYARPEVERAVRHADFAELSRQEAERGFAERSRASSAPFFRQGRAGAWGEALDADQVRRVEDAHRLMMARLGYETVTS